MKLQERERISESMRILHGIAKDGKATVFVLAQINRDGEHKASLSKLQGSSSIEQDSDNVLILDPKEDEYEPSGRSKSDIQMVL
ncbi:DnaB-like helicase C-terminal domain-containing protein, partial [Faecalibaculum rodentium]|uniref:DnaB-like helicase C-terminal domain-containing protein n=1 Tax=Faecalibaculum rodentium TaxID=1702221 RepID=UPI00272FAEDF